jgi:hypothetical protein
MLSNDFLDLAQQQLDAGTSEAMRRRAISTAYYAVFHRFAEVLTAGLLGFGQPEMGDFRHPDWLRVYRAFGHEALVKATQNMAKSYRVRFLPREKLTELSTSLSRLKDARHLADYDPSYNVHAVNITTSVLEDAKTAFFLIDNFFEDEFREAGLARRLALDALGIKERT